MALGVDVAAGLHHHLRGGESVEDDDGVEERAAGGRKLASLIANGHLVPGREKYKNLPDGRLMHRSIIYRDAIENS